MAIESNLTAGGVSMNDNQAVRVKNGFEDFRARKPNLLSTVLLLWALCPAAIAATIGFKPAISYPVGTAPLVVAAGDFNGDGKLDLAVANSGDPTVGDDGGISILFGNGDGTFQPSRNVSAGKSPGSVAVVDLNGDGQVDLVVTNGDGGVGQVGVLLG